jgi:nucleotide-binding universal stress UspA family protein
VHPAVAGGGACPIAQAEELVTVFQNVKTVIVGADSSPTAREAVVAAAELARFTTATLHIVTSYSAYQGPNRSSTGGYVSDPHPEMELLEDLAEIGKDHGLETVLHHSKDAPADAIVKIADEIDADLVVVGNKGMKGVSRILGSVPNSVAHNAPCSVVIVDTLGTD